MNGSDDAASSPSVRLPDVTDEGELFVDKVFAFSTLFTAVFAAVAGILIFSSEAQHGTLAPTLTAQPVRLAIATAKTLTAAAFGAVLGAAGLVAGLVGASASDVETGDASTILGTILWAVLFVSLASILGLGIGMAGRHNTAAISGLLVWWLVVENLLNAFVDPRLSRLLPFVAGNGLLPLDDPAASVETLSAALSRTENALVFGGYATLALAIGTVLSVDGTPTSQASGTRTMHELGQVSVPRRATEKSAAER